MKKILFEDALIFNAAKFFQAVARALPLRAALAFGSFLGILAYGLSRRREVAYRNLRAAFAGEMSPVEMRRVARRSLRNIGRSAIELLRAPDLNRAYVDRHVTFKGREHFEPLLHQGKGLIFLAAHFGNWELLNILGGVLGYPISGLVRAQKHPRSDAFLNSLRSCQGGQVILKGMNVRELLRTLKAGRIVGILSDQDGGKNGTFVRFFGRLSSTPSGVASFAMRTGSTICPLFMFREGAVDHRIEAEKPLVMPEEGMGDEEAERFILQQFAEALEGKIRRAPDQWLWAHRRWKSTPDRAVLILSDGKAGHLNQSLAMFQAIRARRREQGVADAHTRRAVLEVRYRNAFWRRALAILCILSGGRLPFKEWLIDHALERTFRNELLCTYADVVISCGSSTLPANLLAGHLNRAKTAAVMKPPFSRKVFDAVVVPRHDGLKAGDNTFVTDRALSLLDTASLKEHARHLLGEDSADPRKKIGLLVGGDAEGVRFDEEHFRKVLWELERFCLDSNTLVLATSSRRTPRWADRMLKETLGKGRHCRLLVIANESNPPGVLAGILGASDTLVVSGESVSMVSEAASSGKPVLVFQPAPRSVLKPKHRRFLDLLTRQALIVESDPAGLYEDLRRSMGRSHLNGSAVSSLAADQQVLQDAARRLV